MTKIRQMRENIENIRQAWASVALGPEYRAKVLPDNVNEFTEVLQEYVLTEVKKSLYGADLDPIQHLRDSFLSEWTKSQLSGQVKRFNAPDTDFMFIAFHGIRLWAINVTELMKFYWVKKSGKPLVKQFKDAEKNLDGLLTVISTNNPHVDTIAEGITYLTNWMENIVDFIEKYS